MATWFENPSNGYREKAGDGLSWLWCFLFCPIYMAINGLWGAVFGWVIIVFITSSLFWAVGFIVAIILSLAFALDINIQLRKKYLRRGWREVELVNGKWEPRVSRN